MSLDYYDNNYKNKNKKNKERKGEKRKKKRQCMHVFGFKYTQDRTGWHIPNITSKHKGHLCNITFFFQKKKKKVWEDTGAIGHVRSFFYPYKRVHGYSSRSQTTICF